MGGKHPTMLLLFLAGLAVLYVFNISGWLMHDDEGTDFYEAWQLQQGKRPGVDFLAEQQPLYLLVGSACIAIARRSPLALRLLSASQVLLGALALSLVVRRIWNEATATLTLGLTLGSGLVYEQARLFRPDPMMLAWEMVGLGAALLAIARDRRTWWALAGFCYGMSILWKPFGVLPVVGIFLYFLDWLWRDRADKEHPKKWQKVIVAGLIFAIPFIVTSLGISAWLYHRLGFYYPEAFVHHLNLGQDHGLLTRSADLAQSYACFLGVNMVFVLIIPLWLLNSPPEWHRRSDVRVLLWQLCSPVAFLAMTRPAHLRYFFYLIPPLAILTARQFRLAFSRIDAQQPRFSRFTPLVILLIIAFAILITLPSLPRLLLRREADTLALAEYVASHTQPADKVLSDYAGINFFANRASIYEASIMAGAQIEGEIITGRLLIERIEDDQIKMVLIHIEGGSPSPDQIIKLVDYDIFRKYVLRHFELLTVFSRAGQQIEVYKHK